MHAVDEKCTQIVIGQSQHHARRPDLVCKGREASRGDKTDIRIQETDI